MVGSLLMSLLRHADRVGIAALAQLVNVIAPIRAEPHRPAWRQTTFFPFALTARHAAGDVLLTRPRVATMPTTSLGDVPAADVVVTWDAESEALCVLAVNRHQDEPVELRLDLRALGRPVYVVDQQVMGGEHLDQANTADAPSQVAPRRNDSTSRSDDGLCLVLPAVSWTMLRLSMREPS